MYLINKTEPVFTDPIELIKIELENIRTGHLQLKAEHQRLKAEHQRLKADHQRLKTYLKNIF
jgi:FtsZ-binding cell division protein ZapB